MRKILFTYLPASMLLAFLAMVLLTCGGGGGDDGGSSKTLTGLSVSGPLSMSEYGSATYAATASWDDNTTSTVTPDWSVNLQTASISPSGELYCAGIDADQVVTITATYSSGGITETDSMDVTVTDAVAIPFTDEELSGKVFFEEESDFLYILNANSTLKLYAEFGTAPGDPSYEVTGTWSNDPDGLDLNFHFADYAGSIVQLIADSPTEMEVAVFDKGWDYTHISTWEKTMSVDPVKLPGTYAGSDGYTWVFNADGTGSVPDFGVGGLTFTWSVDSEGVLRMPADTGYTASFYARATSQSTATEYTVLKAAFPEHNTSTGNFYFYYGGIELTRQGGAPPPAATLTGLSINGPSSMDDFSTATYSATASWSDGSATSVTPTWSVNSQPQEADISADGVLSCHGVNSNDQTFTITATYSSGGVTKTGTKNVSIAYVYSMPFANEELSGKVFFEENLSAGGAYDSHIYILNSDFSFEQYSYENPPDTSNYVIGTWSNDVYSLKVNISGKELHVQRIRESSTEMEILIYEGLGPPSVVTWERIVPVDGSLVPGTYVNQFGDTWIFNADGTGSTTGDGGWTYTWSVDTGVIKVVFIANNYVGSMWARAGTQSNPTGYTVLKWAFAIHAPTGEFGSYYGGMNLTRQ